MKRILGVVSAVLLCVLLAVPCFAADFVPSINQGGTTGGSGSKIYLVDEEGNKTAAEGLEVVPFNDRIDSGAEIKSALEAAYDQVANADDLASLDEGLNEVAKEINPAYDSSVFVVGDVLYVSIPEQYLTAGGEAISGCFEIKFKVGKTQATPVIMVQNSVTKEWSTVAYNNVVNNGDGTISVKMKEEGTVALLWVDETKAANAETEFLLKRVMIIGACAGGAFLVLNILFFVSWRSAARRYKKLKKAVDQVVDKAAGDPADKQ